jgi:Na+-driven multidrug efflux pump
MRASGVALATVVSQVFTAVVILALLRRETDETKVSLRKIRIYKKQFIKILKFGVPSGIQSAVYSISNIVVQFGVNSFGAAAIAGSAATTSITDFYIVMLNSLYQASMVFVSQNFGAQKLERIKKIMRICVAYVLCLWVIQACITFSCGKFLIGIYTKDLSVAEWAWRKFQLIGSCYGIMGFMNVMSGTLRGMGASIFNMITSIIGVCGIRILWLVTAFPVIGTYEALWVSYPLSWTGTLILHFIMFLILFRKETCRNQV